MAAKRYLGTVSALERLNELSDRIADPGGTRRMQRQLDRLADPTGLEKMIAHQERLLDPTGLARRLATHQLEDRLGLLGSCDVLTSVEDKLRSAGERLTGTDPLLKAERLSRTVRGATLNESYGSATERQLTRLAATINPFTQVQDLLAARVGDDLAAKWTRLMPRTLGAGLWALCAFEHPTAVMSLLTRDDMLGSLTWLEPAVEDDTPTAAVIALHARPPAHQPTPQLTFQKGSGFNCKRCGERIELDFDAWLTKPDTVFLQGTIDVAVQCPNCADASPDEGADEDFTLEALHEIERGEEDDVPESGVYRIRRKTDE
jgi:hypothetical protein